jgi:hypothetical protein|nr:MAG TPA: hypothetical protein [Caudoviricetes sp.]
MSLSYDLMRAENDVARLDFEKEYDEIISDLIAIYNRYYDTFKNAFNENTGAIIDLLIERCSQDFFAYAALVYVLCSEFQYTNEGFLSHTMTYQESLKKLREEAEKDALLNTKEAC